MMTNLEERISALCYLGEYLQNLHSVELEDLYELCFAENKWFTRDNIIESLEGIKNEFLDEKKVKEWINNYEISEREYPKKVGLILAGNIPAVGFNDIFCVFISGNISLIKYSDKDKRIIPFIIKLLLDKYPQFEDYFIEIEMLKDFDAVIATGSNNSSRYFNSYFGKYPNIIRKNRNSVAILTGEESNEDLTNLVKDIFSYFGLGCRNVSKIFIPRGYDLNLLLAKLRPTIEFMQHNKYANNFDYNIALFLLNKVSYVNNGFIILLEDQRYASRIASLHYEYYDDLNSLEEKLNADKDKIQCIVSTIKMKSLQIFPFGEAQCPTLFDYADGLDTMDWLVKL